MNSITKEDISKHIECYYMHHENSNGEVKKEAVKAYRMDDLNWLFNNIDRLNKEAQEIKTMRRNAKANTKGRKR